MGDPSKLQFDSYNEESLKISKSFNLSEFIKNRMEEVLMMTETINESPFRGQTFQRLPKHMRRRQMSHCIKRLPNKFRRPFLITLKDGLPSPTKRPSRKFRRRPGNLLLDYNRRQKNIMWLETHIWHAKRFFMTTKWGYKLPEMSTNKNFKACYRAISEHCLLLDMSYYNCIELNGSQDKLLQGLKQCSSSDCGLTFGAKMFLNGSKEGSATIFHPCSYPYGAIGNVTFMWEPNFGQINRKIWIWVHPLMHDETVECFKAVFNLSLEDSSNNVKETVDIKTKEEPEKIIINKNKNCKKSSKKIEQRKLEPKHVPFTCVPEFKNKDGSVIMFLLRNTLNRFRLAGPLSHPIITETFNVASIPTLSKIILEKEIIEVPTKKIKLCNEQENKEAKVKKESWWSKYYKSETHRKNWENQKEFYHKMSGFNQPTDVAPGMIFSLVIKDPRLNIPSKRKKLEGNIKDLTQMPINFMEARLSASPIWDSKIRDEVSMTKLTNQEINENRQKTIVPGFDVDNLIPEEDQSKIPILLVMRSGQSGHSSGKLGLGSGWDIIAPAGFGMPIWLSLVLRGARPGGLRETKLLDLECQTLKNCLQPDSVAGEKESQSRLQKLKNQYFKLPPDKRPNFFKLGVRSPFYSPWKILVKNWILSTQSEEKYQTENLKFSVLRSRKCLLELNSILENFLNHKKIDFGKLKDFGKTCLVPVIINCTGRGRPKEFALINLPTETDLKNTNSFNSTPAEPTHEDKNHTFRKSLKSEHKKVLKSLRRKRKKSKNKLKEEFASNLPNKLKWKILLKMDSAPSKVNSEEYNSKMKDLWLPDLKDTDNLINSCSRKIVGFVVNGDFCLSKSFGVALGYVTLLGLLEALKICKQSKSDLLVLLRNTNEISYRFAKIKIAVD